jgi:hypothetical protein
VEEPRSLARSTCALHLGKISALGFTIFLGGCFKMLIVE